MILKNYIEFINEQWSQEEVNSFMEKHHIKVDYTDISTGITYYTSDERLILSNKKDFFYREKFPIQFSEVKDVLW